MTERFRVSALAIGLVGVMSWAPTARTSPLDGPSFSPRGELARPTDYREWVFVTSGLGMTYGPAQDAAGRTPLFDNVFVTRDAFREFQRSGIWPDKTMFVLEVRRADTNVSINNGGHTQGNVVAIEASVKDRERFPDGGWGYFNFGGREGLADSAPPLPSNARCYACHKTNTAVDNTFVQFYPTLFETAKRLGTVKPTYDPLHKP